MLRPGYMSLCQAFPGFLMGVGLLWLFPAPVDGQVRQYKQQTREAIAQIVDGEVEAAVEHLEAFLAEYPRDLESFYGLAVAHAQLNHIDTAMDYVAQAVDGGLPFSRFLAGPRELLLPLTESDAFQKLIKDQGTELLHGPLVGSVTDTEARFWVRTRSEVRVQFLLRSAGAKGELVRSRIVNIRRGRDYTAVVAVRGLKPDTEYHYDLLINGRKEPQRWSFRTFPPTGKRARFQVGFGGGAGYNPPYERMWNTLASRKLPAFLLLGDNVYIDNPTRPAVQQYCYYRRQSRPEFRQFTASTAIFAIWDDHDFTTNDAWGGPEIDEPAWKLPVWRTYRNNWNNPSYGGGESQPGCWFDFSIGDVDFFMLDGRYYRTDPEVAHPSILGPVQKAWLFEKLKASRATFKVIASPVPWAFGTKPGSLDTWEGYKAEREEIFSFLEEHGIDGVILLSADRHRSDAWKIEREKGYDLYEFESSKISNVHTHALMPGALFGYNEKCSFGLLTFDTLKSDPEVTYEIISIDNEVIHSLTLTKSQLTHAMSSEGR